MTNNVRICKKGCCKDLNVFKSTEISVANYYIRKICTFYEKCKTHSPMIISAQHINYNAA